MTKEIIRQSEAVYGFLLKLYPKDYLKEYGEEMKYVFSESLKDAYSENGGKGVVDIWTRTIVDVIKSSVAQHLDNPNKKDMENKRKSLLMQNKVFVWIAGGTVLLLMVPFSLMTFRIPLMDPGSGMEVINWSPGDFIVMGMLIFTAASTFVIVARKINKKYRLPIAVAFVLGFLWLWAELAVGIFTNWGS